MGHVDDLIVFSQVVAHRGYAPAGRALGIPKSNLSRRIAQLEERLGVRLIQRDSRHFAVTDVGLKLSEQCRHIVDAVAVAETAVHEAIASPQGQLRVTCPIHLVQSWLAPRLPEFLAAHPSVEVRLDGVARRVDLLSERIDVAIRARSGDEQEPNVVVRQLFETSMVFVADPRAFPDAVAATDPEQLRGAPALNPSIHETQSWVLTGPQGQKLEIPVRALLVTNDLGTIRTAALAGCGIAQLPNDMCQSALADGRLARVLPGWYRPVGHVQAAFPTRRGMVPAVRAFVDFLATLPPRHVFAD